MSAARCAHPDCRCPRRAQSAYCGPYCANAAEGESLPGEADLDGACACGHAACRRGKEQKPAPPEVVISTGRP